jgi:hypothetical protein
VLPGLAHRTVWCTREECLQTLHLRVSQVHLRYNSPDCPVRQRSNGHLRATVDSAKWTVKIRCQSRRSEGHRTVRCHMRTKPPTVGQLQALTGGWRGGTPDIVRWRTGHCLVAHRTVRCAHRQQPSPTATFWLVAINSTPTGHFKVWEPKQHSKSSSWHIQALPTTSIHW